MRNPTPERDRRNRLIGGQPTNEKVGNKMTAFVFDHSVQMPIAPAGKFATGDDQISSAKAGKFTGRCINSSGRSAMGLHVGVGGSPDTRGVTNFMGQGQTRIKETSISQRKR
jgi:hypothetical protein